MAIRSPATWPRTTRSGESRGSTTPLRGDVENYQPATGGSPEHGLSTRETLEHAGVTVRAVDLGSGDFGDLPDNFTYVLHLAWMRADLEHLELALRTNVEAPGLLLQHCRGANAALVMSGMGVYSPSDDPWHAYTETDPIGRGATACTRPPALRQSSASNPSRDSAPGPSTCPS